MTTFRNTAYSSETDYLTNDLNALADEGVFLGDAIDNSSNRHKYCKVQIQLASVDLSSQSSPGVKIRLIETIDGGTVYEDNDDKAWAITLPIAATNAAHVRIGALEIPPSNFKLAVVNDTGVALAATGNVLSYVTFTEEDDAA